MMQVKLMVCGGVRPVQSLRSRVVQAGVRESMVVINGSLERRGRRSHFRLRMVWTTMRAVLVVMMSGPIALRSSERVQRRLRLQPCFQCRRQQ